MAVEIKELHIKTSIRNEAKDQRSMNEIDFLRKDLEKYCKKQIQEQLNRSQER